MFASVSGAAVAAFGKVLVTEDGGETWSRADLPSTFEPPVAEVKLYAPDDPTLSAFVREMDIFFAWRFPPEIVKDKPDFPFIVVSPQCPENERWDEDVLMALLDEVLAGLNHSEIDGMIQTVLKIREQGITIIMIEHVMKAVMNVSDRIIVLDYGEQIAEGSPESIARDAKVIEAYLGDPQLAERLLQEA